MLEDLDKAIIRNDDKEFQKIVKTLIENPGVGRDSNIAVLHTAVLFWDVKKLRVLIRHHIVDIDGKEDVTGDTALHVAMRIGNVDAVRVLIGNGADLFAQTVHGDTPLTMGIENAKVACCAELLRHIDDGDVVPKAFGGRSKDMHKYFLRNIEVLHILCGKLKKNVGVPCARDGRTLLDVIVDMLRDGTYIDAEFARHAAIIVSHAGVHLTNESRDVPYLCDVIGMTMAYQVGKSGSYVSKELQLS